MTLISSVLLDEEHDFLLAAHEENDPNAGVPTVTDADRTSTVAAANTNTFPGGAFDLVFNVAPLVGEISISDYVVYRTTGDEATVTFTLLINDESLALINFGNAVFPGNIVGINILNESVPQTIHRVQINGLNGISMNILGALTGVVTVEVELTVDGFPDASTIVGTGPPAGATTEVETIGIGIGAEIVAQSAAIAVSTRKKSCWYNLDRGVDYEGLFTNTGRSDEALAGVRATALRDALFSIPGIDGFSGDEPEITFTRNGRTLTPSIPCLLINCENSRTRGYIEVLT